MSPQRGGVREQVLVLSLHAEQQTAIPLWVCHDGVLHILGIDDVESRPGEVQDPHGARHPLEMAPLL